MSTERCGYTLVDAEGEQYPCDRPAPSWRWYQNVEHEDSLDEACELHENEGGRRMAQQAEQIATVRALAIEWQRIWNCYDEDDEAMKEAARQVLEIVGVTA